MGLNMIKYRNTIGESIERMVDMNKRKKTILLIVAIVLVCACGAGIIYKIYSNGKKELFFDPDSKEYKKYMTVYDGEMIEMDDYKVALETSLYDAEVGIGYFVFSIQQTDGETDYLNKFFDKYYFMSYPKGKRTTKVITKGNTMYYYLGIEYSLWVEAKDRVYLVEKKSSADYEYIFDLISISNNRKYEYDGEQVVLSPIGIRFNREEYIKLNENLTKPNTVILKYNDGTKDKTIIKDGKLQEKDKEDFEGMGNENEKNAYTCSFKNIMDITNVESIVVDGNEYKLVTE